MSATIFTSPLPNTTTNVWATYTSGAGSIVMRPGFGATISARLALLGLPAISASAPLRFGVYKLAGFNTYGQFNDPTNSLFTIYTATGLSTDTLTGVTTVEGTTDQNYSVGDVLAVTITPGQIIAIQTAVNNLETGTTLTNASKLQGISVSATAPTTSQGLLLVGSTWTPSSTFVLTSGSYSQPSWLTSILGSIVSGNITGNAANVTGTVQTDHGGTGQVTTTAAFNALMPLTTLGDLLYASGTNTAARLAGNTTTSRKFLRETGDGVNSAAPAWDTLVAGDIPSLPASIITSGQLPPSFGGTGAATAAAGFNALSPMTAIGDLIYGGASGAGTRLSGNGTATRQYLSMTSSVPAWGTISAADVPVFIGSGASHAVGVVPDPGASAGSPLRYLREDATWATPVTTITNSDGTITISPTSGAAVASIALGHANTWTGLQTYTISDSATNSITEALVVGHNTSGTPASGFGTRILFQAQDSTTADQVIGSISAAFTGTPTHGSAVSLINLRALNAGTISVVAQIGFSTAQFNTPLYVNKTSSTQLILNSGGTFGGIQNDSSSVWSLAYGSGTATLGTPVLSWNASGQVWAANIFGSNSAAGTLTLSSTIHATPGNINVGNTGATDTVSLYGVITVRTQIGGPATGFWGLFNAATPIRIASGSAICWQSQNQYDGGTSDTRLTRDAANVISSTNGTTIGQFKAGGFIQGSASKITTYILTTADGTIRADGTSGAFAVTLPAANAVQAGRRFTCKKTDSSGNAVTLTAAGSDKIDGSGTYALSAQYKYVEVECDGSANWLIVANN